jgi:hypothetical protein
MESKGSWYGIECEGRYSGLFTYFVRDKISNEIDPRTKQIYFTKEALTETSAKDIEELSIVTNYVISVEVDKDNWKFVTPNIRVRCHLMYRIVDDNIFELKETDSIFIDKKNMYNVLCFTKHNALVVTPNDYSKDFL